MSKKRVRLKAPPSAVDEAIAKIKGNYQKGIDRLRGHPSGSTDAAARVLGINSEALRKAVVLAERVKPSKLESILAKCRKHGTPLSQVHFDRVLTISDQRLRDQLLDSAITNHWSVRRLNMEIKLRRPAQKHAGRRRTRATNSGEVLVQVHDFCVSWRRWYEDVTRRPGGLKLEGELAAQIVKANTVLGRLAKLADSSLNQHRAE
jgi:hypothetical protein